jgi:endo-1,4-beta-xylanase
VISYSGTFNGGNNGYVAVYGWMENPLIEYYILETWGSWDPKTDSNLTYKGIVTSDGGAYNIYTSPRYNAPNITGTDQNFTQYWSIRTSKKSSPLSGTVTVANHFNRWQQLGMSRGSFASRDYQIVETEGYQSSSSSNITVGSGAGSSSKSWQTFGSGVNSSVYALVVNSNTLYAGGYFTSPGNHIAVYK